MLKLLAHIRTYRVLFGVCGTLSSTHSSEDEAASAVKFVVKSSTFRHNNSAERSYCHRIEAHFFVATVTCGADLLPECEVSDSNQNILSSRVAISGPYKVKLQQSDPFANDVYRSYNYQSSRPHWNSTPRLSVRTWSLSQRCTNIGLPCNNVVVLIIITHSLLGCVEGVRPSLSNFKTHALEHLSPSFLCEKRHV